ncbi:MAG: HD domain-containing protein [Mycobacterium sp.]|nr:HD domain-containing protein [Mycobacterium sp.]
MDEQQLAPGAAAEIAAFAFEMGVLKRESRKGWIDAQISRPESVADHTCRTAQLAAVIAAVEDGDASKAAHMAIWHDSQETRTRDLTKAIESFLPRVDHNAVTAAQTARLPDTVRTLLQDTVAEFESQTSLEAVCARDADRLECLLQALEYQAAGNSLMQEWIDDSRAKLETTAARNIADAAMSTSPLKWRH